MTGKDPLRAELNRHRAALTPQQWAVEDASRTRAALETIDSLAPTDPLKRVIALYASRPGEPGTLMLLRELAAAGWSILLPKLRKEPDWAWYEGQGRLAPGWGQIPEPMGPALGAGAIALAEIIVVPALAVGRDGSRLGTGGGWYDRALPHRSPSAQVLVIARSDEVRDSLPTEPHDVAVDLVVTEHATLKLPMS